MGKMMAENPKVLIFEINQALAGMWADYLNMNFFDTRVYIAGDKVTDELVDWGLPDVIISGFEFYDKILSGEEYCKTIYGEELSEKKLLPVIQLYGKYLSEENRNTLMGSAFSLQKKPVSLAVLLGIVRKAYFAHLNDYLQKTHSATMTAELSAQALTGILQFIDAGKRSGTIILDAPSGENAMICFNSAKITNAECMDLVGTEAVLELLTWGNGRASFYEFDQPVREKSQIPDIQNLLSEALRQKDELKRAESNFSSPFVTIHRNEKAKISDKAIFSEQIFMALETPKNLETLRRALPELTFRQLMVALNGMLDREEIFCKEQSRRKTRLSKTFCSKFLNILDSNKLSDATCHPVNIGVFSATPNLSKKFIGTLCDKKLASNMLLYSDRYQMLLCEMYFSGKVSDFLNYSAVIIIFDRSDSDSLATTVDFLDKLKKSHIDSYAVALGSEEKSFDHSFSSCAEILGLTEEDVKIVPVEWTKAKCVNTLKALLESEINKDKSTLTAKMLLRL
jgi:hypothetical protein